MSSNTSCSLLILLSLLVLLILDFANLTVSSSCPRKCGGINIPYPFGIGMGCYLEHSYEIECVNYSSSIPWKLVPFLSAIRKEVVNIYLPTSYMGVYSMDMGFVRIKNKITSKGCSSDGEEHVSLLNLTGTPFYVSHRNRLIASGCNNMASLTNVEPIMVGCKSSCSATNRTASKDYLAEIYCDDYSQILVKTSTSCNGKNFNQTSCNGFQCCETNMPAQIQQIVGVRIDSTTTTGGCKVAFLTDEEHSFLNGSDPKRLHAKGKSTVALSWFIHTTNRSYVDSLGCQNLEIFRHLREKTLESTYGISCICDYNAYRSYARCSCNKGYHGNPYLQGGGGCKDVNECLENDYDGNYKCMGGTCVDLQGHYECEYKKHRPLAIGDMQPDEYVSENEEEREEGVVEVNIKVESWNNVAVTAPTYQCNIAASSSLWSDVEPLFPLQTL
ncbi:unnamed protein product [Arabidopsis arenosa]|uniref:Uncharacterized protein n=1 Tax=Arabidopsis arenosa TaxID=38785 RepID=A0A8S1ZZQ4_ARAAE|nr:unnamed protein product [Arabidopsis arenosa]